MKTIILCLYLRWSSLQLCDQRGICNCLKEADSTPDESHTMSRPRYYTPSPICNVADARDVLRSYVFAHGSSTALHTRMVGQKQIRTTAFEHRRSHKRKKISRRLGAGAFMKGETLRCTNGKIVRGGVGIGSEPQERWTVYGSYPSTIYASKGALSRTDDAKSRAHFRGDYKTEGSMGCTDESGPPLQTIDLMPKVPVLRWVSPESQSLRSSDMGEVLLWIEHTQRKDEPCCELDTSGADVLFDLFINTNECSRAERVE